MDNKQKISKAVDALAAYALRRCTSADLQQLLDLCRAAMDAVHALPDAVPLASGGSHDTALGAGAGFAIATQVADETQALILAELRKQTELLTTLCQHQDDAAARHDGKSWRRTAKPIPPPPQPLAWDYDPITGTQSPPKTEEVTAAAKSQAGSAPLEFPEP